MFDPSHPREKPCGGGVTGRALALVAAAVVAADWPSTVISSARFVDSARGLSAVVPLEDRGATAESALTVASRAAFDAALVDAAVRPARRSRGSAFATSRSRPAACGSRPTRRRPAASRPRRRRRQQPRAPAAVLRVPARSAVDRHRLLRARRDQPGNRHRARRKPPGYIWSFPRPIIWRSASAGRRMPASRPGACAR